LEVTTLRRFKKTERNGEMDSWDERRGWKGFRAKWGIKTGA
jgi:hypothetical protein